jgi:hypothetical protein
MGIVNLKKETRVVMEITKVYHFLRWFEEKEKSSGSHKILSLFSISLINQTREIAYFYSFSLSLISLFSKSSLPNTG